VTVTPLLFRVLRYGAVLALVVAVLGGIIGGLVADTPGVFGALVGAAMSAVFLGMTAVSILIAGRVAKGDLTNPVFFGIVLGIWLLKLILFFVLSLWLRTQDWIDPAVFGFTAIAAVLGSLIADAFAFQRTRIAMDVSLPGDDRPGG
jgi:hypothetical protein